MTDDSREMTAGLVGLKRGEAGRIRGRIYAVELRLDVTSRGPLFLYLTGKHHRTWTLEDALDDVSRMDVSRFASAADYLKAAREILRQSQRGMAILLNVPKRTYEKWENAPTKSESRSAAKIALLTAFATNPTVFLQAINNPPPFRFAV